MTELLRCDRAQRQESYATPLDGVEFFTQFTEGVHAAGKGDRISIATMAFDPREKPAYELTKALLGAQARGADIRIALDDFGYLLTRQIGLVATSWVRDPEALKSRRTLHKSLEIAGAKVTTINTNARPLRSMYSGRSHAKIYAINDLGYISGHNLLETWRADTAVALNHPDAVATLHDIVGGLVATGKSQTVFQGKDRRIQLPHGDELLIDAGKPGQSLIMREALKLIDEAEEHITMTTQLFPLGRVVRHLQAAAKRGVRVDVTCAHPSTLQRPATRFLEEKIYNIQRLLYGSAAGYHTPEGLPTLHSKILMNEKKALVGSHNFDPMGVLLGNTEISLLSLDPEFITTLGEIVLAQTTYALAS